MSAPGGGYGYAPGPPGVRPPAPMGPPGAQPPRPGGPAPGQYPPPQQQQGQYTPPPAQYGAPQQGYPPRGTPPPQQYPQPHAQQQQQAPRGPAPAGPPPGQPRPQQPPMAPVPGAPGPAPTRTSVSGPQPMSTAPYGAQPPPTGAPTRASVSGPQGMPTAPYGAQPPPTGAPTRASVSGPQGMPTPYGAQPPHTAGPQTAMHQMGQPHPQQPPMGAPHAQQPHINAPQTQQPPPAQPPMGGPQPGQQPYGAPRPMGGPLGGSQTLLAQDAPTDVSASGVQVGTASPTPGRTSPAQPLTSDSQGYLAMHKKGGHARGRYPTPSEATAAYQQPAGMGMPPPMGMQQAGMPGQMPPQPGMPGPMGMQQPGMPGPMGMQQPGMPGPMGMQQPGMPGPMGMQQPGMPGQMPPQPGMPGPMGGQPGMPGPMGMQQHGMPGQMPGMAQPGMPGPMVMQQPGMPGQMPGMPGQMGMQQPGQMGMAQAGGMVGPGPLQRKKSGARIDPNQIPSPVAVMEKDQREFTGQNMYYGTCSKPQPPLATTDYIAVDQGNSSPRHIRMSLNSIAQTEDLSKTSKIPLAAVICPLAELRPGEKPIPLVDHGPNGPIRCRRCKAYINPFVQFVDGGRRFGCNVCGFANEVPQEYFCNLDYQGRRMDLQERPELLHGTVDFAVTSEYSHRPPKPCRYMFLIDVSFAAVQSGMLTAVTWTIKNMLDKLPKPEGAEHSPVQIGIATYDRTIQFYNLHGSLSQPQQLIVCDTDDAFVPLGENGLTVNVHESREVIEQLLDKLPSMFERTREQEARIGAALDSMRSALETTGGRVFVFHMNLPSGEGKGQLKNRDDSKALGTDRESSVLKPQGEFYTELGKNLSKAGIGVDMFLFPPGFVDVATLGEVSSCTGGHCYVYPSYNARADGQKFAAELSRAMTRPFGYEAIMRVRASEGLRPTNYHGGFVLRNGSDMEMACVDSDKAVAVRFHYDGTIPEGNQHSFVQVALLYTSATGQRLVRVLNYQLRVTSQLSDMFRHAELDTVLNYLAKQACDMLLTKSPKQVKDSLTEKAVEMLAVYRKHCATSSSPGQLILPEALKLLPVYMGALHKTDLFRTGADMRVDRRAETIYEFKTMPVPQSVPFVYSRMLCVGDYQDAADAPLPSSIRTSYERLEPDKQYIIENGLVIYLWVGQQSSPQWLQAALGVHDFNHIDTNMFALPELDTPESKALHSLVNRLRGQRVRFMRLYVCKQRDGSEAKWNLLMQEDAGLDTMSYVDFLCYIHRQIQSSS